MKRRELFSSLASSFNKKDVRQENIIRPPYYSENSDFINSCKTCNHECIDMCETNIIVIHDDQTVKLDFTNAGCTYCDECAKACPTDALKIEDKKNININININIIKCLSWNNTMCFSCKDPCIDDAIHFIGMFRPEINDQCTSCGYCINVCPTDAIEVKI